MAHPPVVIYAHKLIGGTVRREGKASGYVKRYDPEAYGGRGWVDFTDKIDDALQFETKEQAIAFVMQVPRNKPKRSDGQPNKPLTAFTLEIRG